MKWIKGKYDGKRNKMIAQNRDGICCFCRWIYNRKHNFCTTLLTPSATNNLLSIDKSVFETNFIAENSICMENNGYADTSVKKQTF